MFLLNRYKNITKQIDTRNFYDTITSYKFKVYIDDKTPINISKY